MDRFAQCLAETLKWEGGYSNDPHDPGGATMRGVIQVVYDGFRDSRGLPRRHVREIENTEVLLIYRNNYWNLVRGDELPPAVDLVVFDFGVNSGPTRAIKALQTVLGVAVDGHLGAATLAAVRRCEPVTLCRQLMAERRRFLAALPTYWRFGKGWMARCDGIEAAAQLTAGSLPSMAIAAPLADADAQSAEQGRAVAGDPLPPWKTEVALGTGGTYGIGQSFANAFGRVGDFHPVRLLIAVLSEPMFWVAVIPLVSAFVVYFWRKAHAR
jgi:lysozyme family protein